MRPADFNVVELIEYLQGTCETIEVGISAIGYDDMESEDLTRADTEAIDNEISRCDNCGWWMEPCEMSEDCDGSCCECFESEE